MNLRKPSAWTPESLFSGADGAWFDPSDLSTVYQDSVGSIAGAVNAPIGLLLDKSKGVIRGVEKTSNGNFATDTLWAKQGAGVSISGNLIFTAVADGSVAYQNMGLTLGKFYEATYTILSITAGAIRIKVGASGNGTNRTTPGTYTEIIKCVGGDAFFYIRASGGGTATTGTVDSVSVREIPGNHAVQPTTNARPILRKDAQGRYFVDYDGVNDSLIATLPVSTTATVVCAGADGAIATLTNQTIGVDTTLPTSNLYSCVITEGSINTRTARYLAAYLRHKSRIIPKHIHTANRMATPKTKAILNVLTDLPKRCNNRIIAGQHTHITDNLIPTIISTYGKCPGLIGVDYAYQNNTDTNNLLIGWANSGSLINVLHHWGNPLGGDVWNVTDTVDFTQLITEGSALNITFKTYLDAVAVGLTSLQTAGVSVMYRPFHEMNGNWFWWGNKLPAVFKAAWQYVFNYLTSTKGLNNILWVYAPNANIGNELDYYPGDDFVDVVGVDLYGSATVATVTNYAELVALGKPFGLTEYGPSPAGNSVSVDWSGFVASLKNNMPAVVFWMNWALGWSMTANTGTATILNDPWVVTQDEI